MTCQASRAQLPPCLPPLASYTYLGAHPVSRPMPAWLHGRNTGEKRPEFCPQGADSFKDPLGCISSSFCVTAQARLAWIFAHTRKQECHQRKRISKEANLRDTLWPKMGQLEHQKNNTCAGLRHVKYLKIHEFIMTLKKKKISPFIFGGCYRTIF